MDRIEEQFDSYEAAFAFAESVELRGHKVIEFGRRGGWCWVVVVLRGPPGFSHAIHRLSANSPEGTASRSVEIPQSFTKP